MIRRNTMIYVLTGIAKSGKTLVASEIQKKHNISVFSTDYIMMMLHRGNSDLNIDINASDSTVAKDIEPYIYNLIKTMIESNATYLIEGVHFNTDFSKKLLAEFKTQINILYLGYKNITVENKVKELYKYKNTMNNPWLFNHNGESLEDIVTYMIKESRRIYNECYKLDLPYIDVHDINIQKDSVITTLLKKRFK